MKRRSMFWNVLFRWSNEFLSNVMSTSDNRACSEEYRGQVTDRCTQINKTLAGTESTGNEKERELNDKANNNS